MRLFLIIAFLLFFAKEALAQSAPDIIINEIHDEIQTEDEWTELIVVKDNLDLRGWFIGDNTASTDTWRPKLKFKDVALWNNLRRGTYIILQHAMDRTDCNAGLEDVDKKDGYIRICVRNTTYFDGGDATTMVLPTTGDFLHLVDPSGKHITGLGYDPNPGGSVIGASSCLTTSQRWTNTTSAQANTRPCGLFGFYNFELPNGRSLAIRDSALGFLNAGAGTFIPDTNDTRIGLEPPTPGHGNTSQNIRLIQNLRRPDWTGAQACLQVTAQGNLLQWAPVPDLNPAEVTVWYLVLRGDSALAAPRQGNIYPVGEVIQDGARRSTVIGFVPLTQTSFIDTRPTASSKYRVYAFRYWMSPSGDFGPDRGPAYNLNEFYHFSGRASFQIQGTEDVCDGDTVAFSIRNPPMGLAPAWAFDTVRGAHVTVIRQNGIGVAVVRNQGPARDSVFATATITGGPCGTVTVRAAAQVQNRPVVSVTPLDTTLQPGQEARFAVEISGTSSFVSAPPVPIIPPIDTVQITFLGGDTSLIVRGFIPNLPGCSASDTGTVHQLTSLKPSQNAPSAYFYNNILTSGNRGNYYFVFQGGVLEDLHIYDRQGREVYTAHRYDNSWHGQPGMYFFKARLMAPSSRPKALKGWIEVVK